MYVNFWFEAAGIKLRDDIGADHILWSANLPLANSTWPRTRETIDHCFNGVSADARERVL